MNKIKVSIITPLYKGTDYIPGLMAMIRKNAELLPAAQKGKNVPKAELEFILVNDSPADGLLKEEELIRNYVPDQAFELTAVNHTENQGIHAARLTGLSKAQGEYILFLDQDDAISDSAVRTLLTAAEQTHADVVAGNGCRLFFTPEHILEKQIPIYAKKAVLKEVGHEKMYLYGTDMIFSPGQCLIRKPPARTRWRALRSRSDARPSRPDGRRRSKATGPPAHAPIRGIRRATTRRRSCTYWESSATDPAMP